MLGTLNVTMLTVSRLPYALAVDGHLPRVFARVHRRYRTPYVAVICASLPKLRKMQEVPGALFMVPGGVIIPGMAVILIGWLLASSSWIEARDVALSILVGGLVYAAGRGRAR